MTELTKKSKMICSEIRNAPGVFATKVYNYLFIEEPDSTALSDTYVDKLTDLLDSLPSENDSNVNLMTLKFTSEIWNIKRMLSIDLEAFVASDPAANSKLEIMLAYPGFFALSLHRMAHFFYRQGARLFSRLISEYAHRLTGIDIHPGAFIDTGLFIDHGTGIVIGETAVIGKNVKIFQGVTLGALSVDKWRKDTKRHPTVEDNVVLYAGCTILGGNTVIGHNSVIGGNVWLTQSVIPYSTVVNQSKASIMQRQFDENYFDYMI
ncbi:MAG: serine O-acetyltransferase EpsC [Bacteroidota bacterium]|nr:serine O-acetyltransferase EpsC [Bacteroidota bacterium]